MQKAAREKADEKATGVKTLSPGQLGVRDWEQKDCLGVPLLPIISW